MRPTPLHSPRGGFSLVEITLALGIVAFGIVAIMGLLSVSMDSTQASNRDTTLAGMSRRVLGDLRSRPFDALWAEKPWEVTAPKASQSTTIPPTRYFFTAEGALLEDPKTGKPLAAAEARAIPAVLYECVVKKTPDTLTKPPPQTTATGSVLPTAFNLLKVELIFSWPATIDQTALPPRQKQSLHATIARY